MQMFKIINKIDVKLDRVEKNNLVFSPRGPVVIQDIDLYTWSIITFTVVSFSDFHISSGQDTHFNKHNDFCCCSTLKTKINT